MDNETILRALQECHDLAAKLPGKTTQAKVRDMAERARVLLDEGRREKVMRWLGFMQGILWSEGVADLEALKRMNMAPGEIYDADRK